MSCIEAPQRPEAEDDIVVGALLPFAGDQAASGLALERAITLVEETVNAQGGLDGRRMRLLVRDGHTDPARARRAAEELRDEGAHVVVGPVDATTARAASEVLEAADVLNITGSWAVDALDVSGTLMRTAPTSQALASVLALRARDDGVTRLAIVHVADGYGMPFAEALVDQFLAREGVDARAIEVAEDQTSFESVLRAVEVMGADGIVLVTYLRQAAELALALPRKRLYLTSTLKNPLLLRNVPERVFEGAVGVSPAVPQAEFNLFTTAYRDRWSEEPLAEAAFFFDATALAVLAIQRALHEGLPLKATTLQPLVVDISRSPVGASATWFGLADGLARVASGVAVNYQGASGAVDLNDQGQVGRGLVELWQISEGAIVSLGVKAASPK
jgi:branched-chain amino acid transport system substrate-binding protein